MRNKDCIYIGGGIDPNIFIYLVYILEGYCSKYNYSIIIQNSDFLDFVQILKKKNKSIKEFSLLNRKIIIYDYWKISFKAWVLFILSIIKNFIFYIKLLFFFSYTDKRNYKSAFSHGYWDSCIRNLDDNQLKPGFLIKLKCLCKLILTEIQNEILSSKYSIKTAFLGHSVYNHRITLESFRKKNIKTFVQANNCLIRQKTNLDTEWTTIENNLFKKIKKNISQRKIYQFWKLRSLGKLDDKDYIAASKIKKNLKYKHSQNIIFLHVFKDSPFASIDNTRIFFDYYHWIIETIKILKHSNEVWSLRTHPNCSPWGEDSLVVLNEIIKKHFNGILPKNIKIDNKYSSNLSVFNKMSRCVTFSGTSSIESSCYGIKPIIISNNALSKINKEYVLKPKNILEYKKLLLKKSSDKVFVQKKKIILDSKYLLYCLYNVLSFNEQLKVKRNVVSGMTKHEKLTIFFKLYKYFKSKSMRNKFINIGINLKKNNTRTLNYKFIHLLDIK